MCTHVVYAFATIDAHGYGLMPHDHEYDVVKGMSKVKLTVIDNLNLILFDFQADSELLRV